MLDHKQTRVFYPGYREYIEVDEGIAPLLLALWDAGIMTCNSCQENEPGIVWIEFYSIEDVEKLLSLITSSLGDEIESHPEADDWFCYRILGQSGEKLDPWRFDAHPNLCTSDPDEDDIYPEGPHRIELSISVRFPVADYPKVLGLLDDYLINGDEEIKELSDDEWAYISSYLPPQPSRGRKRLDDRRTINGILYVLKTGCSWRKLPKKYGSYVTAHRRLKQWSSDGIIDRIFSDAKMTDQYKERLASCVANSDEY